MARRIIRPPAPLRPGAGRKTPAQQQAESDIYRRLNGVGGVSQTGSSLTVITRSGDTSAPFDPSALLARLNALDTVTDAERAQIADLYAQLATLEALTDTTPRLLTGGEITPLSDTLGLHLAAGTLFNGTTTVSFNAQDVTLAAADPSDARFDELVQDLATGDFSALPGIPSATPYPPDFDATAQLDRGPVLIAAGATSVGMPDVAVFHEGTEWTGTASNGTWSLSTATPHTGTYHLAVNGSAGAYTLTAPSPVSSSAVAALTLWVEIVSWPFTRSVSVWFQQPGTIKRAGNVVSLRPGSYGLTGVTGAYQQATVPLSAFGLTSGASLGGLKMSLAGSGGAVVAAVDDVVLAGSAGVAPSSSLVVTATSTVTGTVKTTADHLDPVVYEKTEMDALLAGKLAGTYTPADAGTAQKGVVTLSVAPVIATAPIAVGTNDPRLSDGRAPTGTAGGDLTGSYPNPSLAPVLTPGSAGDGTHSVALVWDAKGRITSATPVAVTFPSSLPPSGTAGGDLTGAYPNPALAAVGTAGTYGDAAHYPVVTLDAKGRVTGVTLQGITSGYMLPTASSSVLGGVKVGSGLSIDGSGVLSATPPARAPAFALSGAIVAGLAVPPLRIPAFMDGLALTRLQARVETPGTTDTMLTLQLSTSTGAFAAAVTSQNVTLAAGVYEVDITSITTAMTAATGSKLGVNVTAAGTGASDLSLTATFN